jgi:hypothetical protein
MDTRFFYAVLALGAYFQIPVMGWQPNGYLEFPTFHLGVIMTNQVYYGTRKSWATYKAPGGAGTGAVDVPWDWKDIVLHRRHAYVNNPSSEINGQGGISGHWTTTHYGVGIVNPLDAYYTTAIGPGTDYPTNEFDVVGFDTNKMEYWAALGYFSNIKDPPYIFYHEAVSGPSLGLFAGGPAYFCDCMWSNQNPYNGYWPGYAMATNPESHDAAIYAPYLTNTIDHAISLWDVSAFCEMVRATNDPLSHNWFAANTNRYIQFTMYNPYTLYHNCINRGTSIDMAVAYAYESGYHVETWQRWPELPDMWIAGGLTEPASGNLATYPSTFSAYSDAIQYFSANLLVPPAQYLQTIFVP